MGPFCELVLLAFGCDEVAGGMGDVNSSFVLRLRGFKRYWHGRLWLAQPLQGVSPLHFTFRKRQLSHARGKRWYLSPSVPSKYMLMTSSGHVPTRAGHTLRSALNNHIFQHLVHLFLRGSFGNFGRLGAHWQWCGRFLGEVWRRGAALKCKLSFATERKIYPRQVREYIYTRAYIRAPNPTLRLVKD